ncbi:Hypothetical protein PBC10988_22590 [Planctomycetales bacterium 10988]|nr:Hypothetical protein PBC10988_22590 [Planctomycetales bacterium 10988]
MHQYQYEQILAYPVQQVFELHTQPKQILRMLPQDVNSELVEAPPELSQGSEMEIRFQVFGVQQSVRTKLLEYEQNRRLVDQQLKGPFRFWQQTHLFEILDDEQTKLIYQVDFEPPGGMLRFMVTADRVLQQLEKNSKTRQRQTEIILAEQSE